MCILGKKIKHSFLTKKAMTFYVSFIVCLLLALSAYSAVPIIKNMSYQYIAAENTHRTRYDLLYFGAEPVSVILEASGDGGEHFDIMPTMVTGDFGIVFPGTGKKANWNIGAEFPLLDPTTLIMRIVVSDSDHTLRYITFGGSIMVLISAGDFVMGSAETPDGMPIFGDEIPEHNIYLDEYYVDTTEVTNAQYRNFTLATGHPDPLGWADPLYNSDPQPVVGVTWDDAVAYANWAGKRLPTEAEWEKASRGGFDGRDFPWEGVLNYTYGNFASVHGYDIWYDTSPVASLAPNDYGLFDMIGNVYEWCADYYHYSFYESSPGSNPLAPEVLDEKTSVTKTLRGGSCYDGFFPSYLRCATRFSYFPATTNGIIGLRCVKTFP